MKLPKTLLLLVALTVLTFPSAAQKPPKPARQSAVKLIPLSKIDLFEIGHINPSQRFQDYDEGDADFMRISKAVVSHKTDAIPWLISKLGDQRVYKDARVDFWYGMTVGDMAFVALTNLMSDRDYKPCIKGYEFDGFLGRNTPDVSATGLYYTFIERNGAAAIKKRWAKFWNDNRARIYFDDKERCFRLK